METPSTLESVCKIEFLKNRIEQLKDCIIDGSNIPTLWIGAGFSKKYAGFPTWREFLTEFFEINYSPEHREYELISGLIRSGRFDLAIEIFIQEGEGSFYNSIARSFASTNKSLPLFLRTWGLRDVITTNFDSLIEKCFIAHAVAFPSSGIDALMSARPKVVKLHGTADNPSTCVASISHYVRNYDNNMEWYLSDVFQNRSVIFIGSSMNVSEPFFKILGRLKDSHRLTKNHYCVLPVQSRFDAKNRGKRLERFGIRTIPYFSNEEHTFIDELLIYIDRSFRYKSGLDREWRRIRDYIRRGQPELASTFIRYRARQAGLSEQCRLSLIDIIYELHRSIIDMKDKLSDGSIKNHLDQIRDSILLFEPHFVRSPRTLKGLHTLIRATESLSNRTGIVEEAELWKFYYEQKQLWRSEKPSNYPDGVP